nr:conjugal transfer protein TraN [Kordiimonas aquimaris]
MVPGDCRDERVLGECSQRVVPGECVQITVPGQCRDEPLADSCPLEGVDECFLGGDGVSRCSDTLCVNTADAPIEELQRERVAYVNDGTIDASGECLNDVQVFTGRGMDCQRPGLLTLFKNCCKNRGEILTDSSGGLGAAATVSTVTAVFSGASAAVSALASGATAASAASAGTAALAAAGGPAIIGAGVYLLFTELLGFGCDQQDFEAALLDGSGMCHFVGTYCVARIPFIGCIQKARSFCCFNSKLGRIIHQQGREQLKNFDGFGEPKMPECRGFTPAEFQALNFSDMDLSEYYDELAARSEAQLKDTFEQGLDAFIQAGKDQ